MNDNINCLMYAFPKKQNTVQNMVPNPVPGQLASYNVWYLFHHIWSI